MNTDEIRKLIIESIKYGFESNPDFKKTDILTMSTYKILEAIFIDNKKIIFLDAPTGTGKSIIGYLIHYCFNYIMSRGEFETDIPVIEGVSTYTLTSSKMLQEQIESDINRFNMSEDFAMLKGQANYNCNKAKEIYGSETPYTNRVCKGLKLEDLQQLDCYTDCEYIQKRMLASMSPSAVINYSYFLTVLNAKYNLYFQERSLTIADEGHLVPQIVAGMFNTEINLYKLNTLNNLITNIGINFEKSIKPLIKHIYKSIYNQYKFFIHKNHTLTECIDYLIQQEKLTDEVLRLASNDFKTKNLSKSEQATFESLFKKQFDSIRDEDSIGIDKLLEYLRSLNERPEDFYFESESIGAIPINVGNVTIPNTEYFKYVIKDLSEAELVKKYFIDKTNILIFMSATIGNVNDFGKLLGLQPDEYAGFNIPSTFDFSKSPIILKNIGWLNYNNFQTNIHKVIDATIDIMERTHPKDKGIVHTSTFQISNMLKEQLKRKYPNSFSRYLFYDNAQEKELAIQRMKTSPYPLVIIGPSLYEGIDLKDDLGRFNIIMKAPYAGITNYTKQKMNRYPFWYERETLEKLQQAIGRTNRHKDDWSITYMMDSMLEKLCWKLPAYITQRIKKG